MQEYKYVIVRCVTLEEVSQETTKARRTRRVRSIQSKTRAQDHPEHQT